jgi:hypothetical protein
MTTDKSSLRTALRSVETRIAAAWQTSVFSRLFNTKTTEHEQPNFIQKLSAVVRESYLYRWLTAEPDPDIIVIDLRDTWTVGPVITLLDWAFERIERAATGSVLLAGFERLYRQTLEAPLQMAGRGLFVAAVVVGAASALSRSIAGLAVAALCLLGGLVALRDDRSWVELKETRVIELLIAAFEPPAPPEKRPSQDGQPADDSESTQSETDEPEGDAFDDPHQGIDRDVADDGAGSERDKRGER